MSVQQPAFISIPAAVELLGISCASAYRYPRYLRYSNAVSALRCIIDDLNKEDQAA